MSRPQIFSILLFIIVEMYLKGCAGTTLVSCISHFRVYVVLRNSTQMIQAIAYTSQLQCCRVFKHLEAWEMNSNQFFTLQLFYFEIQTSRRTQGIQGIRTKYMSAAVNMTSAFTGSVLTCNWPNVSLIITPPFSFISRHWRGLLPLVCLERARSEMLGRQ